MIHRVILVALSLSGLLLAQQPAGSPPVSDNPPDATSPEPAGATSGPQSPQWKGLSVGEKLQYDWGHLFDLDNMVFAGIGAGFDQLRERPSEWGEGAGGLGERYASHVGYYIVQRSVMFPVQAIDHEDTRYFRSTKTTYKGRLGDAFLHTIWRHNDATTALIYNYTYQTPFCTPSGATTTAGA